MTRPRTIAFAYQPPRGPRRRVIFAARNTGGWDRIEQEETASGWRPVGSEIVAGLEIRTDVPVVESYTGP